MAIQGDGTGLINIPEAAFEAEFSIIFDQVTITNPAQFGMFAGHSASQTFLAIKSPSSVGGRIANNNFVGYSGFVGEVVKVEYRRIFVESSPTTLQNLQLYVNDVFIEEFREFDTVYLDKFFAYLSGSLHYTGVLGGNITMTGVTGGDRRYNTNGTPGDTVLVDEISGQNGTFTGFTTGGFLPAAGDIEITTPKENQFILADESGNSTFTVSGSTTTTSAIEYSLDGATWSVLDASPGGTSFSGSVVVNGTKDITVRISDDITSTSTVTGISATKYNIGFWGQSNEVSRNANLNTIVVGTGNPTPLKFTPENGLYSIASDPTGMGGGAIGGSTASWIAQKYSDDGDLVGIVNVAEGGTTLLQWQKGNSSGYYNRITNAASSVGGFSLFTCTIGETDAGNGTTEADAITRMTAICQDLKADFGADTYISYFVDAAGTGTPENILTIRNAYDSVIENNDFAKFGGDTGVIDTGGNIHMTTVAQFEELSQLRYDAQRAGLAPSSTLNLSITGIPPGSFETVLSANGEEVVRENITYTLGALSLPLSLPVGTTVKGYVNDADNPSNNGAYLEGVTE